jgi:hypothetical protein
MNRIGSLMVALVAGAGCAASAQLHAARTSAYKADFDKVWDATVKATSIDFPFVKELDKGKHRIVTCWRPIDHEKFGSWYLFRAIVEISDQPPFRVRVSGRVAELRRPELYPIEHGSTDEPGWQEGRTDRVLVQVHERLKEFAVAGADGAGNASDPGAPENVADTCVLRAEELGLTTNKGMRGILIGTDAGAMGGFN